MGGNDFIFPGAGGGGGFQLLHIDARDISYAVGYAQAAPLKGGSNIPGHGFSLFFICGAVFIHSPGFFPEILMPGKHAYIHSESLSVRKVQIIRRVAAVLAAVAADGRCDSHTQHTVEYGLFLVGVDLSLRFHGVLMHVHIHKAGADDFPAGINYLVRVWALSCHKGYFSALKQQIQFPVHVVCRVYKSAAVNQCPQILTPVSFLILYRFSFSM